MNTIRGWLLVCVLVLLPHGISSLVGLFLLDPAARGGSLGTATLIVTALGNLSGVFLILSRNRLAPAFFTLYPPVLLMLTLAHPDLAGTASARLAAMGSVGTFDPGVLRGLLGVNAALVALLVGYWSRSKRVQAVFGTRGLHIFRGRTRS